MARFEITGGNGRGASLEAISAAIRKAGGKRVSRRCAYGWPNQPHVVTFSATDDQAAKAICHAACEILWPGDESILANLIAFEYRAG